MVRKFTAHVTEAWSIGEFDVQIFELSGIKKTRKSKIPIFTIDKFFSIFKHMLLLVIL